MSADGLINSGLTLTVNILSCILLAILAYEARNRAWQCLLLLALLALSIWRVVDQCR